MTIVKIRARAFSSEWVRMHSAAVDSDGTVRVWDDVAGHYTRCHILSERSQVRARRHARACDEALARINRARATR